MEEDVSRAENPLPSAWEALSKCRSPWLSTTTMMGLSDRSPSDRLRRLLQSRTGKTALAAAAALDASALEHVETVARINAEQAEAAFRRTFVFNISAPLAIAAAAMQALPEHTERIFRGYAAAQPVFYLLWGAILGILATVYYAHIKARGARDLSDVLTLIKASRATTMSLR